MSTPGLGVVSFLVACPMVSGSEQMVEPEQATGSHEMLDSLQGQMWDTTVKYAVADAGIGMAVRQVADVLER